MKNLTKIIILSLSAALLSSCAATSSQPADDSAVVGDSTSITDNTETSENPPSSNGEGIVIVTEEKSDENWLKAPDGYDSFSYDRETYYVSNYEMLYYAGNGPTDYWFDMQLPFDYNEYFEDYKIKVDDYVYIKARLTGDSINIVSGNSADINIRDGLEGAYSPIVIEDIVDTRGNEIDFKVGDIIYVGEGYTKQNKYYADMYEEHFCNKALADYEEHPEDEYHKRLYEYHAEVYQHYREHQNDNWVLCDNIYPMEKGKSYLILVQTTPIDIDDTAEGCPLLYRTGFFNMNLSDDKPDSYGEENDSALLRYGQYKNYWHACKELYGEYFE